MTHLKITIIRTGAILSMLVSAGCGAPAPTAEPTIDANALRTEVAATVLAEVTQTLAARPTATLTPTFTPTYTTAPTSTQPAAEPDLTLTPSISGTPDEATLNRAQWVSQSVADDTVFVPGETFTMTWQLKNVGVTAWSAGYLLRYYSGNNFGAPAEIRLERIVLPNETAEISVPMRAPLQPGNYRTDWVLSNENRINFKDSVFLKIVVALPATATSTLAPTPAASASATP